jgi:hypothetical protein
VLKPVIDVWLDPEADRLKFANTDAVEDSDVRGSEIFPVGPGSGVAEVSIGGVNRGDDGTVPQLPVNPEAGILEFAGYGGVVSAGGLGYPEPLLALPGDSVAGTVEFVAV